MLLSFFILLATSSEADLGFNTSIRRVGSLDFNLEFTIQHRRFCVLELLYNSGVTPACGRGTWVFKVKDEMTGEVCVIKDCWVEDYAGRQMEHEVVAMIKEKMGDKVFCDHFIDISGYCRTDTAGGFARICQMFPIRPFTPSPQPLVSIFQSSNPQQPPLAAEPVPMILPHPCFHYQVIYNEEGESLYQVTEFANVFEYLAQATDCKFKGTMIMTLIDTGCLALQCLHKAGWVHGDLSPGNIIVVGKEHNEKKAKISDLEFARIRPFEELDQLTQPNHPLTLAETTMVLLILWAFWIGLTLTRELCFLWQWRLNFKDTCSSQLNRKKTVIPLSVDKQLIQPLTLLIVSSSTTLSMTMNPSGGLRSGLSLGADPGELLMM